MFVESKPALEFEIGHVLFIDIVGYSKLLIDDQHESLEKLNQIVRNTSTFVSANAAGKLSRLPTGDGMVLVFASSPGAPVQCALEVSRALQSHPELHVRMGIHSGPVNAIRDLNDRANVAGGGINIAQRVMDCGDAGHILVSKRMAEDLEQYRQWQPHLHDLGEVEVKHGVRIAVVNLYTDELGNPEVPAKLKVAAQQSAERGVVPASGPKRKIGLVAGAVGLLAVLGIGAWIFTHRIAPKSEGFLGESSSIPAKSIAVLPFENLSAEKDDAFFADGIQDDVLTSLGKIKELTVIARASVMTYRGTVIAGKLREIGQALGVSHVLEGSVRHSGNHVVINVQLIDTRNDKQVWSERYDRSLTDALSLQGEVAVEIARQLQATLTPGEMSIVATKPTENAEAYLVYLRARELELRLMTSEVDPGAISNLYQQAIDLDPTFALARARHSMQLSAASSGPDGDPLLRAQGLAEAQEASRLRPGMGEATLALAYYYWSANESDRALAELAEAEKLLPNSAEVWQVRATIYRQQNKIRERIAALRRAEILDPRDTNGLRMLAMTLRDVRDWPEAERTGERVRAILQSPQRHGIYGRAWDEFRRTGKLDSLKQELAGAPVGPEGDQSEIHKSFQFELAILERDFVTAKQLLRELPAKAFEDEPHPKAMYEALLTVASGGDPAGVERTLTAARQDIEKLRTASPNNYNAYINLGLIDAFLGRKDEAIREGRSAIEIAAAASPLQKNDASAGLALIYARTGQSDQAIELIEHLLTIPANLTEDAVYNMTVAELKWRWEWDPLRNDPRFQKILAGPEPKTIY